MSLDLLREPCSNRLVGTAGRAWKRLAIASLFFTGCTLPAALKYPGPEVVPRRLAALPSEGLSWYLDFYGHRTPDVQRGVAVKKNIDDSITYRVRRHGGHSFREGSLEGMEHAQEFRSWIVDKLAEIIAERVSDAERGPGNDGALRFSQSLESWRAPLDADFVLVTFFLDGHDTKGRTFVVGVNGGYHAARRAIACVVHLQSARIVWCNFDAEMRQDLELRWGAQQEVDLLLGDMLTQGSAVASEPPPTSTAARLTPADDVPAPMPPAVPRGSVQAPVPVFHAAPRPENEAPR